MEYILYISRFLYRIRWWLLIGTAIITFAVYYFGKRMIGKTYNVEATLYTGAASGYNLEGGNNKVDWATTQNAMDNLMNIIKAESTLKRVSIRLYARSLIKGNPKEDNEFIKASNYNRIYEHLKNSPNGKEILSLIDKNSEDKTVANFFNYLRPTQANYLYGVFYYNLPYYSYNDLKAIRVARKGASDLIEISYTASDPGIAYNTIDILTKEFVNEYSAIRYGETDKVIEYFKSELQRIGKELRLKEDSLTQYNVEKRVINYYDETKEIAAINKEFELREQNVLIAYNSAKAMLNELEKQMGSNAKHVINNLQFLDKLNEAASLTGKISEMETISSDHQNQEASLQEYKNRLNQTRKELSELSNKYVENKYTKEGIAKENIIEQWLEVTMQYEKAKSDLQIIQQSRIDLNEKYRQFAPVGSTIKRQERNITFIEQNYLSVLKSYNDALMRRKNLEMTSATLKVLNEPTYPISPHSTNRKQIVIAACIGSFLIIVALLLLIEMLDRTLRDAGRTKRVTGYKVVGAVPSLSASRYGGLTKTYVQHSASELTNSLLRFLDKRKSPGVFIINLFSINEDSDEETIGNLVCGYMQSRMLNTRFITHGVDFNTNSTQYLLAKNITDFYTLQGEDILIVAYPPLSESSIPSALLHDANANILIASANHGWKTFDKQLCDQLMVQLGTTDVPFRICLTNAGRGAVEDFTGQLPPYTLLRKIGYHLSQLSLTEKIIFNFKNKTKEVEDEDDE